MDTDHLLTDPPQWLLDWEEAQRTFEREMQVRYWMELGRRLLAAQRRRLVALEPRMEARHVVSDKEAR